jgi:hypothetical protein
MNRNLNLAYALERWFAVHPEQAAQKNESALQVPLFCEFMPMRWSYEAIVVAQYQRNPLASRQAAVQAQIDAIKETLKEEPGTPNASAEQAARLNRLEDLKDTLALLSGLEAATPREVARRLRNVDDVLRGKALRPNALAPRLTGTTSVSAETLYVNQKITDLVAKAESEQLDYRRQPQHRINVFFGPEKFFNFTLFGQAYSFQFSVLLVNVLVILAFVLAALGGLCISLTRQLRIQRR